MCPLIESAERADVVETSVQNGTLTIGTSPVEIKAGVTRLSGRQSIVIYNDSDTELYVGGPTVSYTGVNKGIPIFKKQVATFPVGNMSIYVVANAGSKTALVLELG